MSNRKILVTGAAGFIGMHTAKHLLKQGVQVIGLDNLNDYYDPAFKHYRLERFWARKKQFIKVDLTHFKIWPGMLNLIRTENQ